MKSAAAAICLAAILLLAGCSKQPDQPKAGAATPTATATATSTPAPTATTATPTTAEAAPAAESPTVTPGQPHALTITVLQDGRTVTPDTGGYLLKRQPFVLHLAGDVEHASYYATPDKRDTAPLESLARPLVFFDGTGAATGGRENLSLRKPGEADAVKLFDANTLFFIEAWASEQADAEENARFLREQCASVPLIATFGHFSFPRASASKDPAFFLENFRKSPDGFIEGDYRVSTIGDQPVGAAGPVRVVVFVAAPLGRTFSRMTWQILDFRFE
jgi:hypothetical protein